MKRKNFFPLLAVTAGFIVSCNKENRQVPVQMVLTDNPTAYDKVNVEITGIQVKMSKDTASWISLETEKGIYNLLALQNGLKDTIAKGEIPDGLLKEVRFILGTNNSVVVSGNEKALVIPSGSESGLKVKIDKELGETMNSFILDFDAALSIKEENGEYKLRPVIKLKD